MSRLGKDNSKGYKETRWVQLRLTHQQNLPYRSHLSEWHRKAKRHRPKTRFSGIFARLINGQHHMTCSNGETARPRSSRTGKRQCYLRSTPYARCRFPAIIFPFIQIPERHAFSQQMAVSDGKRRGAARSAVRNGKSGIGSESAAQWWASVSVL